MAFADDLLAVAQRERSGETGAERYDYQALWGLTLIFEHHHGASDYAVAFEFHDDIVLLDSSTNPTKARFFQVKTKDRGQWTLAKLTKQMSRTGAHGGRLPSFVGKMFANYVAFPQATEQLNFVSNIPCDFLDPQIGACSFSSCDAQVFAEFVSKLRIEYPAADDRTARLFHFVRADLSLHDSSTHIMGKMQQFVASQIGSIDYNPDALYKTIVEECRARSKFTGKVTHFPMSSSSNPSPTLRSKAGLRK